LSLLCAEQRTIILGRVFGSWLKPVMYGQVEALRRAGEHELANRLQEKISKREKEIREASLEAERQREAV
jgi:hypothetical protein